MAHFDFDDILIQSSYIEVNASADSIDMNSFHEDFWGDNLIGPSNVNWVFDYKYPELTGSSSIISRISNIFKLPAELITLTGGASEALTISLISMIGGGDTTIAIPKPWFPAYPRAIAALKGNVLPFEYFDENSFVDRVHELTKTGINNFIFNIPFNPTGENLSESAINELKSIIERYNVTVLNDKSHSFWLESDNVHFTNDIKIFSFGKLLGIPNLRLGCIISPNIAHFKLVQEIKRHLIQAPSVLEMALASSNFADYDNVLRRRAKSKEILNKRRHELSSLKGSLIELGTGYQENDSRGIFELVRYVGANPPPFIGVNGAYFGIKEPNWQRICLAGSNLNWADFIKRVTSNGI